MRADRPISPKLVANNIVVDNLDAILFQWLTSDNGKIYTTEYSAWYIKVSDTMLYSLLLNETEFSEKMVITKSLSR